MKDPGEPVTCDTLYIHFRPVPCPKMLVTGALGLLMGTRGKSWDHMVPPAFAKERVPLS